MTGFFGIASVLTSVGLLTSLVMGVYGSPYHLMVAMFSSVVGVSLHCLVFGIFTGSGKDTREIAEDLSLSRDYFEKIKRFRKTNFPPALYGILLLMMAIFLGGAVTVKPGAILGYTHGLFALFAVLYNLKTFWLEFTSIRNNAQLLEQVNLEAAIASSGKEKKNIIPEVDLEPVSNFEWGTHVYAFGKFLCFLSFNMALPYIYLRFIMGILTTPVWPFLLAAAVLLSAGIYLRKNYHSFRPGSFAQPEPTNQ